MGRYGRRISRSLIGALVITLVLGMIFFLKDLKSTKAEPVPPTVSQAAAPKPQVVIAPPKPAPATQPLHCRPRAARTSEP